MAVVVVQVQKKMSVAVDSVPCTAAAAAAAEVGNLVVEARQDTCHTEAVEASFAAAGRHSVKLATR